MAHRHVGTRQIRYCPLDIRGTDRFVGLLGTLRARLVAASGGGYIVRSIRGRDILASRRDCLSRQIIRVGTMIGDETVLIQRLRKLHRLFGAPAEKV